MTLFLDDGDVQLHHGDVIQTLRSLPAGIAQTCVTSPPYWGLRSYLPDGHDDKATELGLEATPDLPPTTQPARRTRVTVSQRCTCGARFTAESIPAVWLLFDAHVDAAHGRRFPTAFYGDRVAHKPRRGGHKAPITDQGGR